MTVFATQDDMLARFELRELVQLTDDAGTGAIDPARMDQALASASAMVSGFVAATYQLDPAQPIPLLLVDTTCDLARYKLYRQSPPEDVTSRDAAALRTLQSIRTGSIKLDTGAETIPQREGKIITQGGDRQFSRCQMKGF